jgi:hypothetical protein
MTSQTSTNRNVWQRAIIGALASGAMAVGVMAGFAAPTAFAQPAPAEPTETETATAEADAPPRPCTGDDCARNDEPEAQSMSADEALNIIYNEYSQGDGGGQVSKLIDDAMKLRGQGFRPSSANAAALEDALAHRPHQTPLVLALQETIAYQRKLQAQAAMSGEEGGGGVVPIILPEVGIAVPSGG